jgi:hypothetical protein
MQLLLFFPLAFYFLLMPILLISWFNFFRQDDEMSRREKRLSIVVIAIATVLWPIVLPFAYLELLGKFKKSAKTAKLYKRMLESTTANSQPC